MVEQLKQTETRLPQLQYVYGQSAFLLPSETDERFSYTTHAIQLGLVYPHENWISAFLYGGGQFAHADEGALGSQRILLGGQGGVRLFAPVQFLKMFAVEAGVTVGAGWSKLNFGGGNNPIGGFDSEIGGMARLSFNYQGWTVGASYLIAGSPSRDYTEKGWNISIAAPLGDVAEIVTATTIVCRSPLPPPPDPCLKELASLESKARYESAAFGKRVGELSGISAQMKEQVRFYEVLLGFQKIRKGYLEANHFDCPSFPTLKQGQPSIIPPKISFPNYSSCEEGVQRLKKYLEDMKQWSQTVEDKGGYREKLNAALSEIKSTNEDLKKWDLTCLEKYGSPRRIVFVLPSDKGPPHQLVTEIIFANESSDIALTYQSGLGNIEGFTQPSLDEWIRFLSENPDYEIHLDAYASDNFSPNARFLPEKRKELADKRAENIRYYFVNRGKNLVPGTQCKPREKIPKSGRKYIPVKQPNGKVKKFRIDNLPFVPCLVDQPLNPERVFAVGHNDEELKAFAKSRYGFNFKDFSDPIFRMAVITVWKKLPNGELEQVDLQKLETKKKP